MAEITTIYQDRQPPEFVKEKAYRIISSLCKSYVITGEIPSDVEVIIGEPDLIKKRIFPNLKLVLIPHAGVSISPDTVEMISYNYPNLIILTLHHNAVATAEMGVSLLLSTSKQVVRGDQDLRKGNWSSSSLAHYLGRSQVTRPQLMLSKKKILILGYGHVGKAVAKFCSGLGMEVHGLRKRITEEYKDELGTRVHPLSQLDSLLPSTTVLFSTLPGTSETRGLVDGRRLALLPKEAIVVNIGRASVFIEEDLFTALKENQLYGAGLDVWWTYPPKNEPEKALQWKPSKFDFGSLDNVVMSPHRGGGLHTPEVEKQLYKDMEQILKSVIVNGWDILKQHQNVFDSKSGC